MDYPRSMIIPCILYHYMRVFEAVGNQLATRQQAGPLGYQDPGHLAWYKGHDWPVSVLEIAVNVMGSPNIARQPHVENVKTHTSQSQVTVYTTSQRHFENMQKPGVFVFISRTSQNNHNLH